MVVPPCSASCTLPSEPEARMRRLKEMLESLPPGLRPRSVCVELAVLVMPFSVASKHLPQGVVRGMGKAALVRTSLHPEPCTLRPAPCTLNPKSIVATCTSTHAYSCTLRNILAFEVQKHHMDMGMQCDTLTTQTLNPKPQTLILVPVCSFAYFWCLERRSHACSLQPSNR